MPRMEAAPGLERFSLSGRITLVRSATRGLGLKIARGMDGRVWASTAATPPEGLLDGRHELTNLTPKSGYVRSAVVRSAFVMPCAERIRLSVIACTRPSGR